MIKTAIIVAGGSGSRMQSETPKQFLLLNGFPLLYYTLNVFSKYSPHIQIILVLPEKYIELWKGMLEKYSITIQHTIVEGGPTRFHSVTSGLRKCTELHPGSLVAIHDGVRPFVSHTVLDEGYNIAFRKGCAIPVVPVHESLREVNGAYSAIVPREKYCLVQTPQFFQLEFIADSYNIPYSEAFTDDASVYEASGRQVTLIDGNRENIKITHPVDMLFAEKILLSGIDF